MFKCWERKKPPVRTSPATQPSSEPRPSFKDFTPDDIDHTYLRLWDRMEIGTIGRQKRSDIAWYLKMARKNMGLYEEASNYIFDKTGKYVPKEVIAVTHGLEASFNFKKQILNGQYWTKKTTWVPRGLGPFSSWNEAAAKAFEIKETPVQWTLTDTLYFLERFNGLGYMRKGRNSPYLWSYTNNYKGGKYVSDGKYSSRAISLQVGAALMLKELGFTGDGRARIKGEIKELMAA